LHLPDPTVETQLTLLWFGYETVNQISTKRNVLFKYDLSI